MDPPGVAFLRDPSAWLPPKGEDDDEYEEGWNFHALKQPNSEAAEHEALARSSILHSIASEKTEVMAFTGLHALSPGYFTRGVPTLPHELSAARRYAFGDMAEDAFHHKQHLRAEKRALMTAGAQSAAKLRSLAADARRRVSLGEREAAAAARS